MLVDGLKKLSWLVYVAGGVRVWQFYVVRGNVGKLSLAMDTRTRQTAEIGNARKARERQTDSLAKSVIRQFVLPNLRKHDGACAAIPSSKCLRLLWRVWDIRDRIMNISYSREIGNEFFRKSRFLLAQIWHEIRMSEARAVWSSH